MAEFADDGDIEHTLYINRDVKVYRIPPRPAAGGHKSGEWRVADQIWQGRLRMIAKGSQVELRLEDISSGELFAVCPFVPETQQLTVEPTADSSRYFVLRVVDPASQRHAFLGMGFSERGEAFDFNAAMADHAKHCQREAIANKAAAGSGSAATSYSGSYGSSSRQGGQQSNDPAFAALYKDPGDLSLKDGQTIKIDVHRPSRPGGFLSRSPKALSGEGTVPGLPFPSTSGTGQVVLPPPRLPPPSSQQIEAPARQTSSPGTSRISSTAFVTPTVVASSEDNWATFD
eukprot:GHRR01004778.1.p1 GENE.GHRR01004778.1~~GHRR01004778.1.p1  ORF type:complete len:287 (+),score=70.16 GHRR01004778.1:449-1309(+)